MASCTLLYTLLHAHLLLAMLFVCLACTHFYIVHPPLRGLPKFRVPIHVFIMQRCFDNDFDKGDSNLIFAIVIAGALKPMQQSGLIFCAYSILNAWAFCYHQLLDFPNNPSITHHKMASMGN